MKKQNLPLIIKKESHILLKKVVNKSYLTSIKKDMIKVMSQFVKIDNNLNIDKQLDCAFTTITDLSPKLRSNIYKVMSSLSCLSNLCNLPKIKKILKDLKFKVPRNLGSALFAMEPKKNNYLLHPHQDIRNKIVSNHAINLWFPLTEGKNIGGVMVYPGSHNSGPLKHQICKKTGKVTVKKKILDNFKKKKEIKNFCVGDILLFHPYTIHTSIKNTGNKIRWTTSFCVDDAARSPQLKDNFQPYNQSDFITELSNEQLYNLKNK